jgi:hypothetical protein
MGVPPVGHKESGVESWLSPRRVRIHLEAWYEYGDLHK